LPVVKVALHFAGGGTEEIVLKNGVEFADYIGRFDVPGSQEAPDLVQRGQVRWFSKQVKGRDVIERISLESFNNSVAPLFVGITAELVAADGSPQQISSTAAREELNSGGLPSAATRVLIVGGGGSHDFDRWFNQEDSK